MQEQSVFALQELYAVHGWGTLNTDPAYSSTILETIASVQEIGRAKFLLGNSMHIPSVMAFMLYVLANTMADSDADNRAWALAKKSSWVLEADDKEGLQGEDSEPESEEIAKVAKRWHAHAFEGESSGAGPKRLRSWVL